MTAIPTNDAIRAARRDATAEQLRLAVAAARWAWLNFCPEKPRRRARWDIEARLEAEMTHAENDWRRIVRELGIADRFDTAYPALPHQLYWTPREAAAVSALAALRHASIQARVIRDAVATVRLHIAGAVDMTKSDTDRLRSSGRIGSAVREMEAHIGHGQRALRSFLDRYRAYLDLCTVAGDTDG